MYLIIYCPTVKVPFLELNYFKKSDMLSSNTSEMKCEVICTMLFTQMLCAMLFALIFAMLFASYEHPNYYVIVCPLVRLGLTIF